MALKLIDGESLHKAFNDATGLVHIVTVNRTTNVITDLGAIKTADDAGNSALTTIAAGATGLAAAHNAGSVVSVTNESAEIANANTSRKRLTITNKSSSAMLTISLGAAAVSGTGAYHLAPASDATHPGGTVDILGSEYTGAVNGIMSSADATAGNVGVTEI